MFPEQYKLKPEAFSRERRKMLIAVGPIFIGFILIFFHADIFNANNQAADWKRTGTLIGVIAVLSVVQLFRMLKKKRQVYDDFVLTIDEGRILMKTIRGTDTDLSWIEITRIVKNPDGGFLIISGANNSTIEIPAQIEDVERLEASLNKISLVSINPSSFFTRNSKVIIVGVFATLILFIYSMNKWFVGVTGPVLDILFLWLFINMSRVKQTDAQAIKIKWFLLLPIIGIAIKTYLVLTGRHIF